jgi:GNAT superfamily N-acetyltransferase
MYPELELTKANRLKLAEVFRALKQVDMAIPSMVEGQHGKVLVDTLENPSIYALVIGPFWYFAGDASGVSAQGLAAEFPPYALLMPSAPGWLETIQSVFGERLTPFSRHSFSSAELSDEHLNRLLAQSKHRDAIQPIDEKLASHLTNLPDSPFDLSDFDSAADFAARAPGFAMLDGEKLMGLAYASLVCSQGIEVSIFVDEPYRRQGVATTLAARLLLASLQRGLRPNWDAANRESCDLAEKLGYRSVENYTSWYYRPA